MADSSINRPVIHRGESLAFRFVLDVDSPGDWSCTIHVRKNKGATDEITARTVEPESDGTFADYLTATETDLEPGHYFLIGDFTNGDRNREQAMRFRVREDWV